MARLSWRSGTITLAILCSSSIRTLSTSAGESASATYWPASSCQSTMSTFSPFSSATIAWIRAPRCPTAAPLASTPGCRLSTDTFERLPASRAMPRITTVPL